MNVHFSSKSNEWATPQLFIDELDKEFKFTLDPCATQKNAKCKRYYTEDDDGICQNWDGETVFCNPPYERQIRQGVQKASEANGGRSSYAYSSSNRHIILS